MGIEPVRSSNSAGGLLLVGGGGWYFGRGSMEGPQGESQVQEEVVRICWSDVHVCTLRGSAAGKVTKTLATKQPGTRCFCYLGAKASELVTAAEIQFPMLYAESSADHRSQNFGREPGAALLVERPALTTDLRRNMKTYHMQHPAAEMGSVVRLKPMLLPRP